MREVIEASEGMIYTNGIDIFAEKIWIAEGVSKDSFYEITREEYNRILSEENEGVIPE
jgi:hypothetical protein